LTLTVPSVLGTQRDCMTVDFRPSEALYFALTHVSGKEGKALEVFGKMGDDALDLDFGKES